MPAPDAALRRAGCGAACRRCVRVGVGQRTDLQDDPCVNGGNAWARASRDRRRQIPRLLPVPSFPKVPAMVIRPILTLPNKAVSRPLPGAVPRGGPVPAPALPGNPYGIPVAHRPAPRASHGRRPPIGGQ